MFFEIIVLVRFYMTVLFHFLKPWKLRHEKDEIIIVIILLCFSGLLSSSDWLECLFMLPWNNCEFGTSSSGYLIKNFWKLTDLLCVTDEDLWMCWITVSWSHDFTWSFSWDYEIYYLVSEEVWSSQQIQNMYLLIG